MLRIPLFYAIATSSISGPASAASEWRSLFNGEDMTGWTTTLEHLAPGEDPDHLVQVHDGMIHMYRDTPAGSKVPFGVITHDDTFSHFHLRFEYRWVGKQFEPRAKMLRDAGLLYHVKDASKIWPAGLECQVQEGDTGDIVFINTGGLTWMRPHDDPAPDGQGEAGMLPENGGVPRWFPPSWPYIGRFEEADSPSGWNQVEVIVHGSESAVHIVNGRTIARLTNFVDLDNQPLDSGMICLQLEAAELTYRNIEIRELDPPAEPDHRVLSFSGVKGQPARTRTVTVTNPGSKPLSGVTISGRDADAFEVVSGPAIVGPGEAGQWTLGFKPVRGKASYSAGLKIGDDESGAFVVLRGIGLDAFEGENEPALQDVVNTLGISLDVGGHSLELDKDAATIGESVAGGWLTATGPGKVRVTPLARFSPPGPTPIGIFTPGDEALVEIAQLASSDQIPDAHQSLMPPMADGGAALEFAAPAGKFGFYMKGRHFVSFTDPERPSDAEITHTARVYPVSTFKGRKMKDAWLIGFEEATNGDYQDAVLLVEGVAPAK